MVNITSLNTNDKYTTHISVNNLPIDEKNFFAEAIKCGIIDVADVQEKMEKMKNKDILEQHAQFCHIWQIGDGRFMTKVPDESQKNGKRLIAKTYRENLEKSIIKWYQDREKQSENTHTMETLFHKWLEYKAKDTSDANATKLEWVWNKYYVNSDIIKMDVADIKTPILKEWFLDVISAHKLTKKRYREMKSIANMLLDYALELELVTVNVARNIKGISDKKFSASKKKTATEQVYIDDEEMLICQQAEAQYEKTKNIAYLAVCLNFSLGLRVGELVALHSDDFGTLTVKISRQEVKTYYVDERGKRHRVGYELSPHTKTLKGERELYLCEEAKKYLKMILDINEQRGLYGGYLFLDAEGNRLHEYAVNNVLRRLNRKINTPQKGNHSIRKTCISKMIESDELSDEEIRMFAGHEAYATTQKFYDFATASLPTRTDAFEKALSRKLSGKCNQL